MSWFTTMPSDPVQKDLIEQNRGNLRFSGQDDVPEWEEQRDAALRAAQILANVVGRPRDKVKIVLSGHANPGHEPTTGWSDELITITVLAAPDEGVESVA